jgi:hypothetical protein
MKSLIRLAISYLAVTLVITLALGAWAEDRGEGPLDPSQPVGTTPEQIIQKFAAKEKEFKQARENYTWRQTVVVQTPDDGGEYKQVFDVTFDAKGRRQQTVVFAPQSSLQQIMMSREDFDDINNRLPFTMTTDDLPEYDVLYVGKQRQDEIGTYVFDLAPKKIEKDHRYFQGRIWVDDHDFQIVKTHGTTVPETRDTSKHGNKQENLFPKFTTWREQVDGRYWFPTYTRADDTLHFRNNDVHVREIIKYENYKRFGSNVKITYQGEEVGKGDQQSPQQAPTQTPPPPPKK